MQRAVIFVMLAALAVSSLTACGRDENSDASSSTGESLAIAEEASQAVADLEERADELADDLDRIDGDRRALSKKLERIHNDLRDSIANLRASISDVESDASSARDSAQNALSEIQSALERLSVLENRFNYHLRKDH